MKVRWFKVRSKTD